MPRNPAANGPSGPAAVSIPPRNCCIFSPLRQQACTNPQLGTCLARSSSKCASRVPACFQATGPREAVHHLGTFHGGGYTAGQKPGRSGCGDSAPRDLLHAENLRDTRNILAIGRNRPAQPGLCTEGLLRRWILKTSKALRPTHPITLAVLTALYGTAACSA